MHAQWKWGSYCKSESESSALCNYGQKTVCGLIWREALLKRSLSVVVVVCVDFILHLHPWKAFFFSHRVSAPEFVLNRNTFRAYKNRRRSLSCSVISHAFMHFSLPDRGCIRPIMPRGFHSSPWQSSYPETVPALIPASLLHKPHQDLCTRWSAVCVNIPGVSGTHIACCHLQGRAGRLGVLGLGGCYRCEAAPPVCEEGGRALGRNAQTCELLTAGLSSWKKPYQLSLLGFIAVCYQQQGKERRPHSRALCGPASMLLIVVEGELFYIALTVLVTLLHFEHYIKFGF